MVPHDGSGKWTKAKETGNGGLKVTVLPNPTQQDFVVPLQGSRDKPIQVRVTNAMGKRVEVLKNAVTKGAFRLGTNYPYGTYFAEVLQATNRIIVKLIKQNK